MQPQQQNQPDAPPGMPQPVQQQPTTWQQPVAPVAPDAAMPAQPQPISVVEPNPIMNPQPAQPQQYQQPVEAPLQQPVTTPDSQQEFAQEAPENTDDTGRTVDEAELVRWQAAEHIYRKKTAVWYGIFAVVIVGLIAVAIFLVNSITFAILIPVMAIALAVYSAHPPALINYTLDRKGLHVNDRLYNFDSFKEFGLIRGDDENSIMLVPRKRFQPGLTIYFPDEAGEAIIDMLAARLPMHEVRLDPIDRLIKRLHI